MLLKAQMWRYALNSHVFISLLVTCVYNNFQKGKGRGVLLDIHCDIAGASPSVASGCAGGWLHMEHDTDISAHFICLSAPDLPVQFD